ncbi:DUF2125 domain-containing protein [Rhodopila sp.]|jgi:hypothetical protein|uniref:DUF2125 domain-containing protein n=1 Tax=Rhodopila sp. TaxID=2480087 RepID=UPI002C60A340|nr:DUF2125 domain-containing protein [Rhodopila sp.]HVZ09851.1 DUF2125 domain-containing protein [Rhodopila sp.]
MRRKTWIILAAIPVLLLAGDLAYWQYGVSRLRAGLRDWVAARRAEGWEVAMGQPSRGGWPYAASLTVPNLSLRHRGPAMPGDVRWASASVMLSMPLYQPTGLTIRLEGPQHVQLGDAQDMVITGEALDWSVDLLATRTTLPLTLRARGLRLEPAGGGWHATAGLLSMDIEIAEAPDPTTPPVRFSLSAEAIGLPSSVRWALGPTLSSLATDGKFSGSVPADRSERDMAGWAAAWRDNGGSLEISHFAMGWGPLGVTGGATLALDEELQPMGSGTVRLLGFAEALDRLAAGGVMTKSAATAAKAVLSLLAGSAAGDEPSSVDVPLTLQYRTLSMRQVPLLRLPELDWSHQ